MPKRWDNIELREPGAGRFVTEHDVAFVDDTTLVYDDREWIFSHTFVAQDAHTGAEEDRWPVFIPRPQPD